MSMQGQPGEARWSICAAPREAENREPRESLSLLTRSLITFEEKSASLSPVTNYIPNTFRRIVSRWRDG
jgi:hypothetical protein